MPGSILGDSAGTSTVGRWVGVSFWGLCGHLDGGPLGRGFFSVLFSYIDLVLASVVVGYVGQAPNLPG